MRERFSGKAARPERLVLVLALCVCVCVYSRQVPSALEPGVLKLQFDDNLLEGLLRMQIPKLQLRASDRAQEPDF